MRAPLEALARVIAGRPCVVVGAAPLAGPLVIPPEACLVVVNGGISSVRDREPDVWVLNSRSGPYPGWSDEATRLAAAMLAQGAQRRVGLAVLLTREDEAAPVTLGLLARQRTRVAASLPIRPETRRALEAEAGARTPSMEKSALSAGLTAVCFCLVAGAAHVTLEGFSWTGGYAYQPGDFRRGHVFGDQCGLANLLARDPARLTTTLSIPLKAHRAKETIRMPAPKSQPAAPVKPIKVRAKKMGFYQLQRRYAGQVFLYTPASATAGLPSWLEKVDATTPVTSRRGEDAPAPPRVRRLQPNAVDLVDDEARGPIPGAPGTLAQDQDVLG